MSFYGGKFYSIHSSGNVKEILRRRKQYIEERHNLEKNSFENSKSWIDEYITMVKLMISNYIIRHLDLFPI